MIETVYLGRDNPNTVVFKEDGMVIDFSAATRMVLSFAGSTVVADTDQDSSLIDWSQGGGVVEFKINSLNVASGLSLYATLIVYDDTSHINGQVLAHSDSRVLMMAFVNA